MAEIFGFVTGALSVAALFNNVVDCFEYIHLGRQMQTDYDLYKVRLLLAKTRLVLWGQSMNIQTNPHFNLSHPSADELAVLFLHQIIARLGDAYALSRRYEIKAKQSNNPAATRLLEEKELGPAARRIRAVLQRFEKQTGKVTELSKKARWALYDGPHLETVVESVVTLVAELQATYPAQKDISSLVEAKIQEVEDEPTLRLLERAAEGIDPVMQQFARDKLGTVQCKTTVRMIRTKEAATVVVGDYISTDTLDKNLAWIPDGEIFVGQVNAEGQSRVTVGKNIGGKGPYD
jgi:hypothetical protein